MLPSTTKYYEDRTIFFIIITDIIHIAGGV